MSEARCGRPTATKKPCQGFRLAPFESCVTHLTAEERRQYKEAENKSQWDHVWESYVQRRADLVASAPACWSWPVTRPDSAQVLRSITADDGITAEDTADTALDDWQAGRCAICESAEPLVTDHDHQTGLVRGLLCRRCNTNEGLDHRPGTVYQRYRELPPTRILGVRLRYWDPIARRYADPVPDRADDGQGLGNIGL